MDTYSLLFGEEDSGGTAEGGGSSLNVPDKVLFDFFSSVNILSLRTNNFKTNGTYSSSCGRYSFVFQQFITMSRLIFVISNQV